jgi:hypothetical protein
MDINMYEYDVFSLLTTSMTEGVGGSKSIVVEFGEFADGSLNILISLTIH